MRKIRLLKQVLAITAILLAVMLFMWPHGAQTPLIITSQEEQINKSLENASVDDVGETVIEGPKFTGEGVDNKKWELSADTARQTGKIKQEEIHLDNVKAKAQNAEGQTLEFEANDGHYSKKDNRLQLEGDVTISGQGLTIKTEKVDGNLGNHDIVGDSHVTITGNGNTLEADRFNITEGGDIIRLEGRVKGVFYPSTTTVEEKKGE